MERVRTARSRAALADNVSAGALLEGTQVHNADIFRSEYTFTEKPRRWETFAPGSGANAARRRTRYGVLP